MTYIGNNLTVQQYAPQIATFSGNASTTAFTLPVPVVSAGQIIVSVANVIQNPNSAYSVSGSTLTFTSAPPNGTNNIWVEYTSLQTNTIAPSPGTVTTSSFASTTGSGAVVLQTSPTISSPTMSGAVVTSMASSVITSGTAQATTSGTSFTFSSIPSWVKRITVMFNGVSASGTSGWKIQIGPSGGVATTGYAGSGGYQSSAVNTVTQTSGIFFNTLTTNTFSGSVQITNVSGNTWVASGTLGGSGANAIYTGSAVTLSGVLSILTFSTFNGTDTFTAGSINILYE